MSAINVTRPDMRKNKHVTINFAVIITFMNTVSALQLLVCKQAGQNINENVTRSYANVCANDANSRFVHWWVKKPFLLFL